MMEPFTTLTAAAAPIDAANVDTDQLAPARFLRRPRADGYADILFHDLRHTVEGVEKSDFVLNQPGFRQARIIVADRNFGGGSSREQAVWALVDSGICCVIAESFGDIFYNNSLNHGLLLIRQPLGVLARLRAALHAAPGATMQVDLERQLIIAPDGEVLAFDIEAGRRTRLMLGLDAVGLTLVHLDQIRAFEGDYAARRPWIMVPH